MLSFSFFHRHSRVTKVGVDVLLPADALCRGGDGFLLPDEVNNLAYSWANIWVPQIVQVPRVVQALSDEHIDTSIKTISNFMLELTRPKKD